MSNYRIGDVSKSTGISSFSMKHYEKEGLLTPKTDDKSGYRYYDVPDIGNMLEIRQLRKWNFSIREVEMYLNGQYSTSPADILEEQIEKNEKRIEQLNRANAAMRERQRFQRLIDERQNSWEIRHIETFVYVPHKLNHASSEALHAVDDLIENCWNLYEAAHIKEVDARSTDPARTEWGLLSFDVEDRACMIKHPGAYSFPGGNCLVYYYDRPLLPYFTPAYFDSALQDAANLGLRTSEDYFALFLSEYVRAKLRYERYMLIIPICPAGA